MNETSHLLVDARVRNPVNHLGVVLAVCREIINRTGMTLVKEMWWKALLYQLGPKDTWGAGITYVAIIKTSHLVMHTLEASNEIRLDFFSCDSFNKEIVLECLDKTYDLIKETLNIQEPEHRAPKGIV